MIIDALHLTTLPLDGVDMLLSSDGTTIQVHDPRTGQLVSSSAPFTKINEIAAVPTGWRDPLIAVSADESLSWLNPRTGEPAFLPDKSALVFPLATWAGTLIAGSGHPPYPLLRWDAGTGTRLEPLGVHRDQVTAITVLNQLDQPDVPVICAGDRSGSVRRWNPRTGAQIGPALDVGDEVIGAITPVSLPDGRQLIAAATADLYRWDAITGEAIGAPVVIDSYAVGSLTAVEVNGRPQLITVGHDQVVHRWDAETGERVGEAAPGRCATVLHHYGQLTLAIGTLDGKVELRPLGQTHPDRRV
ncbi:WD40 repeat domain-containing protein [Actinoplanes sp. L3-i22]|uniref:WD40 repeat domain-containing protein n=1 Tax=Actinoplanes sp. L3-i22 TaxID=2836373 RepID=UPI001C74A69A|nr:WD40 repeat domain-containing protein [Actinoplanes sp. L3-i22]BCY13016.1 hypothetical protein L3i22_081040 [Actinoplanes sp. L3-i22]